MQNLILPSALMTFTPMVSTNSTTAATFVYFTIRLEGVRLRPSIIIISPPPITPGKAVSL